MHDARIPVSFLMRWRGRMLPLRIPLYLTDGALLKRCQQIFGLVAFGVIASLIYRHREVALGLARSAEVLPIVYAGLVLAGLHAIIAIAFHWLHKSVGIERRVTDAMASYFMRLPARYLPGGIWHTVSRYVDIHANRPIDKRIVGVLFLAETGVVAVSGLLIAGIAAWIFLPAGSIGSRIAPLLLGAAAVLALILVAAARRANVRPHALDFSAAFVALAANWAGLGAAFALYAGALQGSSLANCASTVLASTYDVAATLGYVVVVAPQGWGVTELSFGSLKTCAADLPTSVAALTGFRVVAILADVGAYAAWNVAMLVPAAWRRRRALP